MRILSRRRDCSTGQGSRRRKLNCSRRCRGIRIVASSAEGFDPCIESVIDSRAVVTVPALIMHIFAD